MTIPDYLASGERARLIPVAADSSKEARAASILLATLENVPAFAREMLAPLGQRLGRRAKLDCYTEVVFKGAAGSGKDRPDGLIELDSGGGRLWRCLVEAKIGRAELEADQVERYLVIAKRQKIDAVLTISNQFVALSGHSPLSLSRNSLRGVDLFHWSWMSLLTEAMLLLNNESFEAAEQRYLLAEMARYFSHPSIGVSTFDRMNAEWKDLNGQVQAGAKLPKTAPMIENTVAAWHQEARDLSLLLTRKVGRSVRLRLSRAHVVDPAQWLKDEATDLAEKHNLSCSLEVPGAASPISVLADLDRRSLSVSMRLTAPQDKLRSTSRINWVVRQLVKAKPEGLHVRAFWPGRAASTQVDLASLRENPALLEAENRSLTPSRFEVMLVKDLAGKFAGSKTFIEHLEAAVPFFYEQVGQNLREYVAPPPRLRRENGESKDRIQEIAEEGEAASSQAAEKAHKPLPAADEESAGAQEVSEPEGGDSTGPRPVFPKE